MSKRLLQNPEMRLPAAYLKRASRIYRDLKFAPVHGPGHTSQAKSVILTRSCCIWLNACRQAKKEPLRRVDPRLDFVINRVNGALCVAATSRARSSGVVMRRVAARRVERRPSEGSFRVAVAVRRGLLKAPAV